jgi:hypothetical protein
VAVALAALLFAFVLIFGIAIVAGGDRRQVDESIEEGVA